MKILVPIKSVIDRSLNVEMIFLYLFIGNAES